MTRASSAALSKKSPAPKGGSRVVVRVAPTESEASERLNRRGSLWSKLSSAQKAKALNVRAREVVGKKS